MGQEQSVYYEDSRGRSRHSTYSGSTLPNRRLRASQELPNFPLPSITSLPSQDQNASTTVSEHSVVYGEGEHKIGGDIGNESDKHRRTRSESESTGETSKTAATAVTSASTFTNVTVPTITVTAASVSASDRELTDLEHIDIKRSDSDKHDKMSHQGYEMEYSVTEMEDKRASGSGKSLSKKKKKDAKRLRKNSTSSSIVSDSSAASNKQERSWFKRNKHNREAKSKKQLVDGAERRGTLVKNWGSMVHELENKLDTVEPTSQQVRTQHKHQEQRKVSKLTDLNRFDNVKEVFSNRGMAPRAPPARQDTVESESGLSEISTKSWTTVSPSGKRKTKEVVTKKYSITPEPRRKSYVVTERNDRRSMSPTRSLSPTRSSVTKSPARTNSIVQYKESSTLSPNLKRSSVVNETRTVKKQVSSGGNNLHAQRMSTSGGSHMHGNRSSVDNYQNQQVQYFHQGGQSQHNQHQSHLHGQQLQNQHHNKSEHHKDKKKSKSVLFRAKKICHTIDDQAQEIVDEVLGRAFNIVGSKKHSHSTSSLDRLDRKKSSHHNTRNVTHNIIQRNIYDTQIVDDIDLHRRKSSHGSHYSHHSDDMRLNKKYLKENKNVYGQYQKENKNVNDQKHVALYQEKRNLYDDYRPYYHHEQRQHSFRSTSDRPSLSSTGSYDGYTRQNSVFEKGLFDISIGEHSHKKKEPIRSDSMSTPYYSDSEFSTTLEIKNKEAKRNIINRDNRDMYDRDNIMYNNNLQRSRSDTLILDDINPNQVQANQKITEFRDDMRITKKANPRTISRGSVTRVLHELNDERSKRITDANIKETSDYYTGTWPGKTSQKISETDSTVISGYSTLPTPTKSTPLAISTAREITKTQSESNIHQVDSLNDDSKMLVINQGSNPHSEAHFRVFHGGSPQTHVHAERNISVTRQVSDIDDISNSVILPPIREADENQYGAFSNEPIIVADLVDGPKVQRSNMVNTSSSSTNMVTSTNTSFARLYGTQPDVNMSKNQTLNLYLFNNKPGEVVDSSPQSQTSDYDSVDYGGSRTAEDDTEFREVYIYNKGTQTFDGSTSPVAPPRRVRKKVIQPPPQPKISHKEVTHYITQQREIEKLPPPREMRSMSIQTDKEPKPRRMKTSEILSTSELRAPVITETRWSQSSMERKLSPPQSPVKEIPVEMREERQTDIFTLLERESQPQVRQVVTETIQKEEEPESSSDDETVILEMTEIEEREQKIAMAIFEEIEFSSQRTEGGRVTKTSGKDGGSEIAPFWLPEKYEAVVDKRRQKMTQVKESTSQGGAKREAENSALQHSLFALDSKEQIEDMLKARSQTQKGTPKFTQDVSVESHKNTYEGKGNRSMSPVQDHFERDFEEVARFIGDASKVKQDIHVTSNDDVTPLKINRDNEDHVDGKSRCMRSEHQHAANDFVDSRSERIRTEHKHTANATRDSDSGSDKAVYRTSKSFYLDGNSAPRHDGYIQQEDYIINHPRHSSSKTKHVLRKSNNMNVPVAAYNINAYHGQEDEDLPDSLDIFSSHNRTTETKSSKRSNSKSNNYGKDNDRESIHLSASSRRSNLTPTGSIRSAFDPNFSFGPNNMHKSWDQMGESREFNYEFQTLEATPPTSPKPLDSLGGLEGHKVTSSQSEPKLQTKVVKDKDGNLVKVTEIQHTMTKTVEYSDSEEDILKDSDARRTSLYELPEDGYIKMGLQTVDSESDSGEQITSFRGSSMKTSHASVPDVVEETTIGFKPYHFESQESSLKVKEDGDLLENRGGHLVYDSRSSKLRKHKGYDFGDTMMTEL